MGDLSPHFSRREFDCHDGTWASPTIALIDALERLRARLGGVPIRIVSGYRTKSWNRRVGGAPRSQHLYNRAADLERALGVTVEAAVASGFTGVGVCKGVVTHVDVRPGVRVAIFEDC